MYGDKLKIGVDPIDRFTGGGIPGGSIVALEAPVRAPSDLLLYRIAQQRTTLYLSTTRGDKAVRGAMSSIDYDDTHSCFVSSVDIAETGSDTLMQGCMEKIEEVLSRMKAEEFDLEVSNFNVIIDAANVLEQQSEDWLKRFFENIRRLINEVDSEALVVLHCKKGNNIPENRDMTILLSDVLFELEREKTSSNIEYPLWFPKNRGGEATMDVFKVEFEDQFDIDPSYDVT